MDPLIADNAGGGGFMAGIPKSSRTTKLKEAAYRAVGLPESAAQMVADTVAVGLGVMTKKDRRQAASVFQQGSPVLATPSSTVDRVDASTVDLLERLTATLKARGGVGAAAPQIGVNQRVFVALNMGKVLEFVNPKITERHGVQRHSTEGCLSVRGTVSTTRANRITVEAQDRNGKPFVLHAQGLFAQILQHECDHLDGILLQGKVR
jgi:peptide deformylase